MYDVLIIGAGITGLTASETILSARPDLSVALLDKGNDVGGRTATRRVKIENKSYIFDYGARGFQPQTDLFREKLFRWSDTFDIEFKQSEGRGLYSSRGVRSVSQQIAKGLSHTIFRKTKAERITRSKDGFWKVFGGGEDWRAKILLITAPAPQSFDLLNNSGVETTFKKSLSIIKYDPIWAILATTAERISYDDLRSFVNQDSDIDYVIDNMNSGLSPNPAYTFHYNKFWSRGYVNEKSDIIERDFLRRISTNLSRESFKTVRAHRWRYAFPRPVSVEKARADCDRFYDTEQNLFYASDATFGGNAEGSWYAGRNAGKEMLKRLTS